MPDNSTKVQHSDGQFVWIVDNVRRGIIDYTGSTWSGNINMTGTLASVNGNFQSLKVKGSDVAVASRIGSFDTLSVTATIGPPAVNIFGTLQGTSANFGSLLVYGNMRAGTLNASTMIGTNVNIVGSLQASLLKVSGTSFLSGLVGTNAMVSNMTVSNSVVLSNSVLVQWPKTGFTSLPFGGMATSIGSRLIFQPGYEMGVGVQSDLWIKTQSLLNLFNGDGTSLLSLNSVTGAFTAGGASRLSGSLDITPDGIDPSVFGKGLSITRSSQGGQYMTFNNDNGSSFSLGFDANDTFGIGTSATDDAMWSPSILALSQTSMSTSKSLVTGGNVFIGGVMGSGEQSSSLELYGSADLNTLKIARSNDSAIITNLGTGTMAIVSGGIMTFQSPEIKISNANISFDGPQMIAWKSTGSFPSYSNSTGNLVLKQNVNGSDISDFSIGYAGSSMWFSVDKATGIFNWFAGTKPLATLDGTGKLGLQNLQVTGTGASVQIDGREGTAGGYSLLYRTGNATILADNGTNQRSIVASGSDLTLGGNVLVAGTLAANGNMMATGNIVASNVWTPWNTAWGSLNFSANVPLQITAASSLANMATGSYLIEFRWDSASNNYWQTILSGTFGLFAGLMSNSMPNAPISMQGSYFHATAAMPTFYLRSDATSGSNGYPQLFVTFPTNVVIYNAILTIKRLN